MPKKRPIGENKFEDLSDIEPNTSDEGLRKYSKS